MRSGQYSTALMMICCATIYCLASISGAQNDIQIGATFGDTEIQNQAAQIRAAQNQPTQPFPSLTADHLKYIDDLLGIWEQSSSQVKRYTCDYMCWEYDPEFCNWRSPDNNKLAAYMIKSGQIRFSDPDQARFETSALWGFAGPPTEPGQDPKYQQRDTEENRERWICDGQAIYDHAYLVQHQ